jgi:hypothetical protein
LSGQTANRLLISTFNTYSANTQTNLFNKVNTSLFNSYTGVTIPNNYYNKTQINQYTGETQTALNNKINIVTGATQNNVVVFGSNNIIVDSGINKALIYAGLVM